MNMTLNVTRRGFVMGALAAAALPKAALATTTSSYNADVSMLPNAIVLLDGNADVVKPPFSLTKAELEHLALSRFSESDLNDTVTFTREAVNTPQFHMGFRVGDQITRRDLIICSTMRSCNQSAEQLGLELYGSTAAAVDALNQSAHAMGLRNTRFVTPSGYPSYVTGRRDAGTTTARDMANMFLAINQRWKNNPLYDAIMRRGGTFLSEQATEVLIRNGRFRRDDPLIVNGRVQVFATGERYMPNDDCSPFKTGQGTIDGRAERKHVGMLISGNGVHPDIISVALDSSRNGLLERTTALYANTMAAYAQQSQAQLPTPAPTEASPMSLPTGPFPS